MSNKQIINKNGKNVRMIDLNPTKTNKNNQPTNLSNKSLSKKRLKEEVNLLEDSNSDKSNEEKDPNKLTRLSYNDEPYKKYQEKKLLDPAAILISPNEIKDKLIFYARMKSDDIPNIQLGLRIKYIEILEDGSYKYKPGGELIINKSPDYLVLAGNRKSWTVQLSKHIIFVEQIGQIRNNYEQKINDLAKENDDLKENNNKSNDKIKQLMSIININNTDNTKKQIKMVDIPKPKTIKVKKTTKQ